MQLSKKKFFFDSRLKPTRGKSTWWWHIGHLGAWDLCALMIGLPGQKGTFECGGQKIAQIKTS